MLQSTAVSPVTRVGIAPRVLLVEDERRTREKVQTDLDALGYDVTTVATGFEAVRVAAESRPPIVIVDGLLPQMSGFEISRFIRHIDTEYRPHIVLMTAIYRQLRYQNEARLKYGIDRYLIKPFSRDQLAEVLT